MAPAPLFSVIVPVFNGERFLSQCLQSVLDTGYPNLELVVVDDGSSDGSAQVAAAFGGRVQVIRQQHAGPAAARNRGLAHAQGEVVGFLDADDVWTPAIGQQALPMLLANDGLDIVQGLIQDFGGDGSAADAGRRSTPLGLPYAYLNLGAAVYRRRVFDRVGTFDETMPLCEDYDWYLRAYEQRAPKQRIPQTTLLYRRHAGSLTHNRSLHEIGMARVHKQAAARRRQNAAPAEAPSGFPTLADYIGRGRATGPEAAATAERASAQAAAGPALARWDDRIIDLPATGVLCFMVVRNEAKRLPFALDYYRRLGVCRFFVVDNDSADGAREWLSAQPDVYLWHTRAAFGAARCGTDWTEALLRTYGEGRWCLVVDADELLVYPDSETVPLDAFCAALEGAGYRAAMALMIDMYSDRSLRDTHYEPGTSFLASCPYFDRQVYHDRVERFYGHDEHPSLFGGVRRRIFGGSEPGKDERFFYCLNKVPLLKYDPSLVISDNFHWTSCRQVAPLAAGLLHFKFTSDFLTQAILESHRREHWQEGAQYAAYAAALERQPALALCDPALSIRYVDSRQLLALGLLNSLPVATTMPETNAPPDTEPPAPPDSGQMLGQVRALIKAQKTGESAVHADGMHLLKLGKVTEAETAFRTAIAQAPGFAWSHHYLGDVLALQQRWPEAAAAYRRACELNPHFAASHFNLGEVCARQQRWADAIASYRQALALQPDLPNGARSLGRALAQQARELEREAQEWYRRANTLNPDDDAIYAEVVDLRSVDPDLCLQLADALARRGERTRAIFSCQLALQVRPDDAGAYVRLATVLQQDGDLPNAIACCRQAIVLDAGRAGFHLLLGSLLAASGLVDEAVDAYRRSLTLQPGQAAVYRELGDVLVRAGRVDEAATAYAEAVVHGYQDY